MTGLETTRITPDVIEAGLRRGEHLRSLAFHAAFKSAWAWLVRLIPSAHHDHGPGSAVHA